MAVLAATNVLLIRTETTMGTNLNLLLSNEPDPHRHNTRIHRPCNIIIFYDQPRLLTIQL